jgi:hypothetical protein
MELGPSWEAVNFAAIQWVQSILWKPKVHYRVHKSPALVPVLSQIDPVHTIQSYLSKFHFNIVHPPTFFFLVVSFLLAFPPIFYMHSSSPYSCYMPCPSNPPWLDHSNYIWWRVQVMKFLIMYILIFMFLDSRREDKRFRSEWQQALLEFSLLLISYWGFIRAEELILH